MRFVGFIGPSYTMRSVNVDCQRCVNLYPELDELGTGKEKEVAALIGTPGLSLLATLTNGPVRGLYTASTGDLYAVGKNKLYKISSTWNATELGTLSSVSGSVAMADNGQQLVLVDGDHGYFINFATGTFSQITDASFPGADQVCFIDGFFIFNQPDSQIFFLSKNTAEADFDPAVMTFDAADFSPADGNPDNLTGLVANHRDLWLFGEQSAEVWYNSGDSAFSFTRTSGAFVEIGCAARFSIARMANTVFWLGKDQLGSGMVFMAQGYQPQRISTHAVEFAIQSYGDVSGATAFTYQENGHYFYVLNFPSAATSWVFDSTTKLWHERTYTSNGFQQRHRADCHAFAYSTHVVGDYENGNLYQLSSTVYADNGAPIVRQRAAPHVSQDMKRMFHSKFQLDLEPGVGLDGVAQGTDPEAILEWSDDGGHSWSNEHWTSVGKIGATKDRAIWRRLGQARDRVYRVTISDPVKVVLIGAEIDVMQGVS